MMANFAAGNCRVSGEWSIGDVGRKRGLEVFVELMGTQALFCCFSFLGNKIDQTDKREIPTHIGKEFAERYEMRFLETSAKEADNVEKLFTSIAYQLTAQARDLELRPEQQGTLITGGSTPITSTPTCCKL